MLPSVDSNAPACTVTGFEEARILPTRILEGSAIRGQDRLGRFVFRELLQRERQGLEFPSGELLGGLPQIGTIPTIGLTDGGEGP